MSAISSHVSCLARYLQVSLLSYRHANGGRVVEVYSPNVHWTELNQGGVVNFNVLDEHGHYVGFTHVSYDFYFHIVTLQRLALIFRARANIFLQ